MKKYSISKEIKTKLTKLLEDIEGLARVIGKKPEDVTDRDLAAISKMKPRERPNFFLDGDELEQIAQNTKDAGLEPLVTKQGAMDDEDDDYSSVKSYEPTVNMRKQDDTDADGTTTLNYDLSKTDVDGFSTTLADAITTAIQDHPDAFQGSEEKVSTALLAVLKSLDAQDLYDRGDTFGGRFGEGKETKKEG